MSFERLQDKIREMKNPTVAGLDPKLEYVPPFIVEEKMKQYGQTLRCAAEAIYAYNVGLIDALCDVVPAVKPQSAFYERFGFEGVEALKRTVDYAKSKGLYVIMGAKRGDIGSTAEGYSDAYLGSVKVGDTVVDILEGRNAGAWSVGILTGSNLLGLTQAEYQAADPDELKARKQKAADRYREAGADMVIDTILDLPAAIDELNRRMARKEAEL